MTRYYTTHEEAQRNSKRGAAVGAIRIDGELMDLVIERGKRPMLRRKTFFTPTNHRNDREATTREIDSIRKWESV